MNIEPPKHPQRPLSQGLGSEPLLPGGALPQPASSVDPSGLPQPYQPLSSPPQEGKKHTHSVIGILSTVLLFAMAPSIALLIAAFGLQSYQVDGQSMETTLQNRDRLIVNKMPRTWARVTHHPYIPQRGDIIVFNQAGLFDASGVAEKQLIKRVIGLPGDRVVVSGGKITIYDKVHPGGFNPDTTGKYVITASTTPGDVDLTLQPGQIFVCGDNRTNSEDSRYFGPVNANQIVGHLVLRLLPLNTAERF